MAPSSQYEKLAFQTSEIIRGIYWTKNYQFSQALASYSDPVDDYYWTLVTKITATEESMPNLIKEVEDFFQRLGKKFSFYLYPSDQERGVDRWLRSLGYKSVFGDAWMFLEGKFVPLAKRRGTEIKEVKTKEDNELYIKTYTQAYETNPQDSYYNFGAKGVYQEIYRRTWINQQLRPRMRKFIGFYDHQAASVGALYFKDQLGILMEVGTAPQFRGKGLAVAVSQACLQAAQEEGCQTVTLATEKEQPAFQLYQKLGFVHRITCLGYSKGE